MNKQQFAAKVLAAWPGATLVDVATILHEEWGGLDNYVALVRTDSSEFLATTNHGVVKQCTAEVLGAAEKRHRAATDSIRRLLDAALQTDGRHRDPAPEPART